MNIEKIQSYKNITKSLLLKTSELAKFIEITCCDNGITKLLNGKYRLRSYSSNCDYTDLELIYADNDFDGACLSCDFVSSERQEYLRNGDCSARYNAPCHDDIKTFISDIDAIFDDIKVQITVDNNRIDEILKIIK
jgi:hypothetical protein